MVGEFQETITSERRACNAFRVNHASLRYHQRNGKPANDLIRKEILDLAKRHRSYVTPRMTWLLKKRGRQFNHKQVERLYALEALQLSRNRAKNCCELTGWCRSYGATRPNEIWAMDFVYDRTQHGGQLNFLTVIDKGCWQSVEIRLEKQMTGRDVLETLDKLIQEHGRTEFIRSDNGSEFINRELRNWLYDHGVQPMFIEPGSPWQNGYIENFTGKFRDECLNQEVFLSPEEAQVIIDWWRQVHNWDRPHRSLKGHPPEEPYLAESAVDGLSRLTKGWRREDRRLGKDQLASRFRGHRNV